MGDCPRTGGPTCPTGVTCPDGFETRGGTKEGLYTFLRNTFGLEDAEQMAKDECCTQRRSRKLLFGPFPPTTMTTTTTTTTAPIGTAPGCKGKTGFDHKALE